MREAILLLWVVGSLSLVLGAPLNCLDCFAKRAVFVSRGWGPAGGPFYLIKPIPTDTLDRKLEEVMTRDQPSMEFLKGEELDRPEPATDQRVFPIPNLFVSTGWGPLGK